MVPSLELINILFVLIGQEADLFSENSSNKNASPMTMRIYYNISLALLYHSHEPPIHKSHCNLHVSFSFYLANFVLFREKMMDLAYH